MGQTEVLFVNTKRNSLIQGRTLYPGAEEEYYQKCLQLIRLGEYYGLKINLSDSCSNKTCAQVYNDVFKLVLDDYGRREIIKQQQNDERDRAIFSNSNSYRWDSPKAYDNGGLRNLARFNMERHLRFIPLDVICHDPLAKLAAELEK